MSDRLTETERVLTTLRPTTRVDPAWADAELHRITSTPLKSGRRRWRTAGGAALAVVAVGGAAHAGGLVPNVITQRLGDGDQAESIHRIGNVRQVFELTTRDGTHVKFFAAPNDAGGLCWTITHDLSPEAVPEDFGYTCVSAPAPGFKPRADDGVGVVPTDSDHPGAPILFGLSLGGFKLPPGTREVRVTGPGLDRTVPTASVEGWAVELPSNPIRGKYLVEFRAYDGEVLDQVTQEVD